MWLTSTLLEISNPNGLGTTLYSDIAENDLKFWLFCAGCLLFFYILGSLLISEKEPIPFEGADLLHPNYFEKYRDFVSWNEIQQQRKARSTILFVSILCAILLYMKISNSLDRHPNEKIESSNVEKNEFCILNKNVFENL